ncbi:O-antigen ligase family protein [Pedobacter jeongneungensis]|uniref:O-antigen ligase family protein n=1 Tax=Pedobacter jeongneungensis TaxID=947309 RepID=UPI00046A187A|nr:O-antigen ligase family protein [Pedobacter jeongneungensis]
MGAIVSFLWLFKIGVISIKILDIYVMFFIGYILCRAIKDSYPFVDQTQFYDYISYASIYIIIRITSRPARLNRGVIYTILFVALANVILVVLQFFRITPLSNNLGIVSGFFVNPGSLGGFIASVLPLIITLNLPIQMSKWIKGIFILVLAVTLFLSSSRAAYIASTVPFIIYYVPWSRMIKNRYAWIMIILILCVTLFLLFQLYKLNPLSVQGRILIWKVSFQMFLERPFFGHGAGSFMSSYNTYQGEYFQSSFGTSREKLLAGTVYTPFNEFLKILIEGGVFGIFLFSLIIFKLIRAIRYAERIFIPLYLSIFSILIFSIFSYPFTVHTNCSVFFALLGLIPTKTIYVESIARNVSWVIFPIYIFLSMPTFRSISSIKQWKAASAMWNYNEYQALKGYNRVATDLAYNWAFMYNYGAELLRHGHTVEAIHILTKCRSLGDNVLVNNQLGQAYGNIGHYKQAETHFKRATNMVPGMLSQKFALFKLYEKTRNWERYFDAAKEIEDTPVKIKNPEAFFIKKETQSSVLKYKNQKK